jgi:hypothetical protein
MVMGWYMRAAAYSMHGLRSLTLRERVQRACAPHPPHADQHPMDTMSAAANLPTLLASVAAGGYYCGRATCAHPRILARTHHRCLRSTTSTHKHTLLTVCALVPSSHHCVQTVCAQCV